MPSVPVVSAKKLVKVLLKKGFVLHRTKGSHQIYIRQADRNTVSVPVHPGQDLGRGITRSILKDADISVEEFIELV